MQQEDTTHPTVIEQGASLYQAEKDAHDTLELSVDAMMNDEMEDDGGERTGEAAYRDEDALNEAKGASDAFAEANMTELHEAAIKEAAQRVADIYAESEAKET